MNDLLFQEALQALPPVFREKHPVLAVQLGSGWQLPEGALKTVCEVSYADIPNLGGATVVSHAGTLRLCETASGARLLCWCGRRHWYEGCEWETVVMPAVLSHRLGCGTLLVTNAAGGISKKFAVGDLMLLRDHINATAQNPLIGVQPTEENPIFVDMTECYDVKLRTAIAEECAALGIGVAEGTYMQLLGPSYETPAEIAAYRALGADAVGMSTALEAICARWSGMRDAGISFITNKAAGLSVQTLAHDDVLHAADAKGKLLSVLAARLAEKL